MIRKTAKVFLVVLAVAANCFGVDNFIEEGWKGIKPLKTDQATVEKIIGKPEKITRAGYYNYKTDEFFMHVNYSTAPCEKSDYNRGKFNIPENTVLGYNVILSEGIKLSEFKFQREKYTKQADSERSNAFYYINFEDAIHLGVIVVNGTEYVWSIWFYPSEKDEKKFECKKPEATTVKFQESKQVKTPGCKKPK